MPLHVTYVLPRGLTSILSVGAKQRFIIVETGRGPSRLPLDRSTESDRISTPLMAAIRRDQMPDDLRSAFLPGDIILFCFPSHHSPTANPPPAQTRRGHPLLAGKCPWCMADEVCLGLNLISVALLCLVASSFQNKEVLAFHAFRYAAAALSTMFMFLILFLVHIHYGSDIHDIVNLRCPWGVKFHFSHSLARRVLSPSSLLLLQQPILNARSFFRFYNFFISGRTREPADTDVDNCIRAYAAAGVLPHVGLIDDGSHALLGLAPCQDILVGFGWGSSHLRDLYRSYWDWKRWRLAAVLCERLRGRDGAYLRRGDLVGRNSGDPLERLGSCCGHKWLLVDLGMFS